MEMELTEETDREEEREVQTEIKPAELARSTKEEIKAILAVSIHLLEAVAVEPRAKMSQMQLIQERVVRDILVLLAEQLHITPEAVEVQAIKEQTEVQVAPVVVVVEEMET